MQSINQSGLAVVFRNSEPKREPDTISPEAQASTAKPMPDTEPPYNLAKDRAQASGWQQNGGEQIRKVYPVNVANDMIAGVPVKIVTPLTIPADMQTACSSICMAEASPPTSDRSSKPSPSPTLRKPRFSRCCIRWHPSIHFRLQSTKLSRSTKSC
jgi:hypothetical protein